MSASHLTPNWRLFAEFSEAWKGRLAAGFAADVVVLNMNLSGAHEKDFEAAEVVLTICGGEVTYNGAADKA
jgi:predicted amidohydrolase YtcJ